MIVDSNMSRRVRKTFEIESGTTVGNTNHNSKSAMHFAKLENNLFLKHILVMLFYYITFLIYNAASFPFSTPLYQIN